MSLKLSLDIIIYSVLNLLLLTETTNHIRNSWENIAIILPNIIHTILSKHTESSHDTVFLILIVTIETLFISIPTEKYITIATSLHLQLLGSLRVIFSWLLGYISEVKINKVTRGKIFFTFHRICLIVIIYCRNGVLRIRSLIKFILQNLLDLLLRTLLQYRGIYASQSFLILIIFDAMTLWRISGWLLFIFKILLEWSNFCIISILRSIFNNSTLRLILISILSIDWLECWFPWIWGTEVLLE